MGVTSAAVPVKKTSSARYTSSRVIRSSTRGASISRSRVSAVSRVMPGSSDDDTGGVLTVPRRTTKMFSPGPSAT